MKIRGINDQLEAHKQTTNRALAQLIIIIIYKIIIIN